VNLFRFLLAWRTIPLRDREVVDALVDPAHAGPSPELLRVLRSWPGTHYWSDEPDGRHIVFTRPTGPRPREAWALHALLFVVTLFSTTTAGAILAGVLPAEARVVLNPTAWDVEFFRAWVAGLSFSLPLLAILLCHELGHYLTARRYQLDVSPPYFIPAPAHILPIGTLGAFIRLRTIMTDRRQLLDVGAAGPIAGFVVALPLLWIGLAHSHPVAMEGARGAQLALGAGLAVPLGDSLVTLLVRRLATGNASAVILHPTAFAAWFGVFVTNLNLLPIAQLDGGHVLYAALPRWQERVARVFWVFIMLLGWFWQGWWVFGTFVLLVSRGRLGHPPVLDAYRPLPPSRRRLAWGSLLLFAATFAPVPFRL
jgi:membrane-associated protease RseP (regulator of RpoE activity)